MPDHDTRSFFFCQKGFALHGRDAVVINGASITQLPFVCLFRTGVFGDDLFVIHAGSAIAGLSEGVTVKRHPQHHPFFRNSALLPEIGQVFHRVLIQGMRTRLFRSPGPRAVVYHDVDEIELPECSVGELVFIVNCNGRGQQFAVRAERCSEFQDELFVVLIDIPALEIDIHPV